MKLLAFVDMHGSHKALEKIKTQSKNLHNHYLQGILYILIENIDVLAHCFKEDIKPQMLLIKITF